MKNKHYLTLGAACFFLTTGNSHAQNFDELRKTYPGEKAVMYNHTLEYRITLKNGQPQVESRDMQQLAYLTSNATAYMGEHGFSHSDFQKLIAHQAYTTTPDGKKLKVNDFKETSHKGSSVFYDDAKYTSFSFPAVAPGAVGNLEVVRRHTEPHMLSPFYFQHYLPVVNSEFKVIVDKAISLKYRLKGLDTSKIKVTLQKVRGDNVYSFQYKNVPADRGYPDAPSYSWYEPHVIINIESIRDSKGNNASFLSNLDDLYRLNYSFIKNINSSLSPELKHIVDSLTANLSSNELKARNIYSWVQRHIKYVAFENGMEGFIPRDANLVCSRRFGDCKDMSSILTKMLNTAGVKAHFTWLGTREMAYKFTDLPLPLVSDHMICTADINGKYIFLDGTDPTCIFGTPSYGIQGKEAMIAVNEKDFKVLNIPEVEKTANVLADTTWLELNDTGIKGLIKQYREGYYASNTYAKFMYLNSKTEHESMKDDLSRGSNKFLLNTFNVNKQTSDKLTLSASFNLPDYAKKIGDEYYLNLNLFKLYANEQIDHPRRQIPIAYNFKFVKRYVTILKIPAGYKVSYMPGNKKFKNDLWGFDIKYEQKDHQVILTQEFDNNKLLLTNDQFGAWNKVLENLTPLYKETLSLSKL